MKKNLTLALISALILLAGCSKDHAPKSVITETALTVGAYGDFTIESVFSVNTDWTTAVTYEDAVTDWLMLNPEGGPAGQDQTLIITAEPNNEAVQRIANVVFTSGGATHKLTLTQKAAPTPVTRSALAIGIGDILNMGDILQFSSTDNRSSVYILYSSSVEVKDGGTSYVSRVPYPEIPAAELSIDGTNHAIDGASEYRWLVAVKMDYGSGSLIRFILIPVPENSPQIWQFEPDNR